MNLINRLKSLLNDPERSLEEKVFIALTLAAVSVVVVALAGDILYGENIVEIIILIATVTLTPAVTYFGVKTHNVELASRLISLGMIFGIMPVVFIFGGGTRGGAVPWLVFSYMYIGLVMSGVWRIGALLALTIVICVLYMVGFYFPDVISIKPDDIDYLDSATGVIEVGIVCFVMTWFQNRLFKEENRKAVEETKKVEEMNRSQNRFFSSMSHEIRTPINSILGLNEIILRQDDASDEIRKDAGNIQGAGRMLLALVNDILDLSKIEAGKMDIVPVNYNIVSMISEIVNMMWLRAEQKGLEFRIEVDPSIPSELFGDEVRIKQILINLLNNAVKYTKEGAVTLHIEKEDVKEDQVLLMFSIIDTGMGIKQDAIPYLFDAFKRVDEEKNSKIEGTGLGLSIVKQLIDLMNGKITVNSVYTQGSTFQVALWQKITRNDAIGDISITGFGSAAKSTAYTAGFTAPDARILIVDDNEMNLEVEKKLLIGTEIQVDTVTSGAEAISMTLNNHYDVILMDHLMPQMDGIECLQQIRKQAGGLNNHVPIIVLTANAGSENRELYNNSGFDGYLVKPVSGKQLEDTLIEHLPGTKVMMSDDNDPARYSMSTAKGYSRKIPVMITTSSMCDLPVRFLNDHQIDIIPFSIHSGGRTFYDITETNTIEIVRYVNDGVEFATEPPSVDEFEKFFGRELKKAHQIIHISLAGSISEEYERATRAARTYENVKIFNSGLNSSAVGILVVLACKMAMQGKTPEMIIAELDKIRQKVHCSYLADNSEYLMKRDLIGKNMYSFMSAFDIRPILRVRNDKFMVGSLCIGDIRKRRQKYIEYALPRTANPDTDVLFLTYVDLSQEELEWLKERIMKRFKFENIILQRASAVMSVNCGPGAFGLLYIKKGENPYNMSSMLCDAEYDESADETFFEETVYSADETDIEEQVRKNREEAELEWYERIDGIDPEVALKNSGSEDAFRTVLQIFYESIGSKADEIEGFYNAKDWENYTIKVHALKSSARLVGATELADDAQALESAGGSRDIEFIDEHHEPLITKLKSYLEPLSEIFGNSNEAEDDGFFDGDDGSEINEQFDQYLIESVYEALTEGIEGRNEDMIKDVFREIGEYRIPDEDTDRISRLQAAFESGDYDGMTAIIGERSVRGTE